MNDQSRPPIFACLQDKPIFSDAQVSPGLVYLNSPFLVNIIKVQFRIAENMEYDFKTMNTKYDDLNTEKGADRYKEAHSDYLKSSYNLPFVGSIQ